ncbi:MAG: hypothetical protein ABI793_01840 [Flavobacterium sp.]
MRPLHSANYQCVYDGYKKLINNPEGTKFGSKKKQPNYPIIESVAWARKFGDKGI